MPSWPRRRSSWASTWGRSTWSSRWSHPEPSAAACSASAARATRWASRATAPSTRSTATTCSRARSSRGTCWMAESRARATCATRWTCWPSRSSPMPPCPVMFPSLRSPPWCGARLHSPTFPTRFCTTFSTFSRAVTPARNSASCGRASCGTASPARFAHATVRSVWPSRTAAPSPTAACSGCSCPTGRAWASSTRRWSTSPGRGRRSCWVPAPGASRTSRSSASSSPRRRASRERCRSGTGT